MHLPQCAGLMIVFTLGNTDVPHGFFMFIAFLNLVFLVMEARRYSLFTYARNRVLVLERGFHARALLAEIGVDWAPASEIWPLTEVRHGESVHLLQCAY